MCNCVATKSIFLQPKNLLKVMYMQNLLAYNSVENGYVQLPLNGKRYRADLFSRSIKCIQEKTDPQDTDFC